MRWPFGKMTPSTNSMMNGDRLLTENCSLNEEMRLLSTRLAKRPSRRAYRVIVGLLVGLWTASFMNA